MPSMTEMIGMIRNVIRYVTERAMSGVLELCAAAGRAVEVVLEHFVRPPRRAVSVGAVLCAVVLAAGCFHVDYDIDVDDDGSGSIRLALEYDRKALEILPALAAADSSMDFDDLGAGSEDFDPEEACQVMLEDMDFSEMDDLDSLPGVTVETDTELSPCRVTSRVSWDAEAQEAILSEMLDDDARLQRLPEGGWVFELTSIESIDPGSMDGLGDAMDDESAQRMMQALGLSQPTMTMSVALPGRPLQYNADRVSGGTFTWQFDLFDPPPTIFAETVPGGSSSAVWIVVVAVVALLLFVALLGWPLVARKLSPPSGQSTEPPSGQSPEAAAQAGNLDRGEIEDPPPAT